MDDFIDRDKEFLKGVMLGYCQSRNSQDVADLFDLVFKFISKEKAADILIEITSTYFEHYGRLQKE
jgi:plasmid replication initiation protein